MIVNIRLGFYARPTKNKFMHKVIRWWTKSHYSHVQIKVGDTWTSAEQVGVVEFKHSIEEHAYDILDYTLECTEEQYANYLEFKEDTLGAGYDYTGIVLSQILPLDVDNPRRWFCSEVTTQILKILGDPKVATVKRPNELAPGDLAKKYGVEL